MLGCVRGVPAVRCKTHNVSSSFGRHWLKAWVSAGCFFSDRLLGLALRFEVPSGEPRQNDNAAFAL